ncbi:MAG TPA: hypothetical protein VMX17_03955 [Candidatus Glassbacteria bacterium]|nr:hypothetical protein [Candidatus Glassbacteria bacterium]
MNKKGDIPSIIYFIVIIFAIGMVLFVFSHLFSSVYDGLDQYFDDSKYNDTTAHQTLNQIQTYEQSMWDYVFLAIAIGYVIMLIILGFSTQINAVFYFIYGIVAMVGLFVGVALSNAWEAMVETPALAATALRFPITDALLNNFYPIFITVVIVITMIMLFGKAFLPGEQNR